MLTDIRSWPFRRSTRITTIVARSSLASLPLFRFRHPLKWIGVTFQGCPPRLSGPDDGGTAHLATGIRC